MVQPLLVSISALTLATETVRSILKIDDVVGPRPPPPSPPPLHSFPSSLIVALLFAGQHPIISDRRRRPARVTQALDMLLKLIKDVVCGITQVPLSVLPSFLFLGWGGELKNSFMICHPNELRKHIFFKALIFVLNEIIISTQMKTRMSSWQPSQAVTSIFAKALQMRGKQSVGGGGGGETKKNVCAHARFFFVCCHGCLPVASQQSI